MPRMETIESRSGKVLRKPFPCVICALESVEDMPACSGHDQHPLIVRALACHCLVSDVLRPLSVFVAEIIDPHEPLNALRESPLSCFSVSLPHHANQSVTYGTGLYLSLLPMLWSCYSPSCARSLVKLHLLNGAAVDDESTKWTETACNVQHPQLPIWLPCSTGFSETLAVENRRARSAPCSCYPSTSVQAPTSATEAPLSIT
nr:hypothetical protein CFP56_46770 [Quercus suber]